MTKEEIVERVWMQGSLCQYCPQYRRWKEYQGEHFGFPAYESGAECGALENLDFDLCPGLERYDYDE